jgi:uncharacterized membrane protein YdcZ (DUF606 family)
VFIRELSSKVEVVFLGINVSAPAWVFLAGILGMTFLAYNYIKDDD